MSAPGRLREDVLVQVQIFTVARPGPGSMSTMARPRGGDWLADEMAALRVAGADVVVSLLTDVEARELDLMAEPSAAQTAGLRFVTFPIQDMGVPSVIGYRDLLGQIEQDLQTGNHVVVHCRAGIGRSSLVCVGVLVNEGHSVADACRLVSAARGMAVPETAEQRLWLDTVLGDSRLSE